MHDRHFQAQTDPSSSFHVGVCDAAASDPRRAAGKHKAQPISASGDHWIIYVPSHPLWQSCLLTGVRGLLRMPATLLAAVAGELPLNCNESPGSTVVFCTFIFYFLFFFALYKESLSLSMMFQTRDLTGNGRFTLSQGSWKSVGQPSGAPTAKLLQGWAG